MASPEHLAIISRGADAWNRWRKAHPTEQPLLNGANLAYAQLPGLDLRGAKLNSANLKGAELSGAILHAASMNGCDLSGAHLVGADMSEARLDRAVLRGCRLEAVDLAGAHLTGADFADAGFERGSLVGVRAIGVRMERAVLSLADLSWADLRGANLTGATLCGTIFRDTMLANTNLTGVAGLNECCHLGPSTLDHRTYMQSGGLPVEFVQACGVPLELVDAMRGAYSRGAIYFSVFVSYSSADQTFVDKLFRDLRQHGVSCWYAPEHLHAGERIRPRVHQEIEQHDKLLVVLSAQSAASDWVTHEVEAALERERRERRDVLVPVQIDDCDEASSSWVADVRRTRQIADFRNWISPAAYEAALLKLTRALRSTVAVSPD